jgi:hypothetical protein
MARKITTDTIHRIKELHRQGLSARRISAALGIGKTTAAEYVKELIHPENLPALPVPPTPPVLADPSVPSAQAVPSAQPASSIPPGPANPLVPPTRPTPPGPEHPAQALEHDNQALRLELEVLRDQYAAMKQAYEALKARLTGPVTEDSADRIRFEGWNINLARDGYYRANRRIAGKVVTLNLGKDYRTQRAKAKILAKNLEFGLETADIGT